MKKTSWYPIENGKAVIEIQVDSLRQLFDERDPTPFRLKDLDDDAVEYIVSSAQEIGLGKIGKLRILTADIINFETTNIIKSAVKDYFFYQMDIAGKKLHATLRLGFKTLSIGAILLAIAVFLSKYFSSPENPNFLENFIKESFLLFGWVSMWKPTNIFLYEWWPLVELRKLYRRLGEIEVELVKSDKPETETLNLT